METNTKPNEGTIAPAKENGKTSFGQKFWNFLCYGGFIILLIIGMLVFVAVSEFMK
jgi:hypothetical protein